MKLNEIRNNPGAHKRKDKVGRGSSSGLGKTSGRGVKGAKARTGNAGVRLRRRPDAAAHAYAQARLQQHLRQRFLGGEHRPHLQKAIDGKSLTAGQKITEDVLRKAGLAHKSRDGVRLLGKGEITAKLDIEVAGASAGAARSGREGRRLRDHDLQEEGLHEQEGRAGQAPAAPRRSRPEKRAARKALRLSNRHPDRAGAGSAYVGADPAGV